MVAAWIALATSAWLPNVAARRSSSALLAASRAARIDVMDEDDEVEKPTASPAFPRGTVTVELAEVAEEAPTAETEKPGMPPGANLTAPSLVAAYKEKGLSKGMRSK